MPNFKNFKINLDVYRATDFPQDNTFFSNANLNSALNPTY